MEHQPDLFEQRYNDLFVYAPIGLGEVNEAGKIVRMSLVGRELLKPLYDFLEEDMDSIYPVLDFLLPGASTQIQNFNAERGIIIEDILINFSLLSSTELHYLLNVTKTHKDYIIIRVDDLTSKYLEEKAMQQANLDSAVAQGKFEIASEVLHDIGNAVVGFGSYLTRISRAMEQNNLENLQNVAGFLKSQQTGLSQILGAQKAEALVDLMEGIAKTQQESEEETLRSITEQLKIISHIQEILTIQRHYVTGHGAPERKPVNLREVIYDCQSMLFASYEKKGIVFNFSLADQVPIIKGDRTKLMQVVLNLLKNSIEAIDMQGREKEISIELLSKEGVLQLTIRDTGKGFDSNIAARLFERGFTTKNTGTGLGLYNCRSIIESHAGSIHIHSEGPGRGAVSVIKFAN